MAYATITTWTVKDSSTMDTAVRVMQEKYMPGIRALGATQALTIRTGPDSAAVLSVYPDEATRDAAAAKIEAMRGNAKSEFDSEMTGELKGEVVAGA